MVESVVVEMVEVLMEAVAEDFMEEAVVEVLMEAVEEDFIEEMVGEVM